MYYQKVMQAVLWALANGQLQSAIPSDEQLMAPDSLMSFGIEAVISGRQSGLTARILVDRFKTRKGGLDEFVMAALWVALSAAYPTNASEWVSVVVDHCAMNDRYSVEGYNAALMKSLALGFHGSLAWAATHRAEGPLDQRMFDEWPRILDMSIFLKDEEMKTTSPLQTALRIWIDEALSGDKAPPLAFLREAFSRVNSAATGEQGCKLGNVVLRAWVLAYIRILNPGSLVTFFNGGLTALLTNQTRSA